MSDFCKRRRVSTVAPATGVQIAKRTPNSGPKCRKSFTQIAHSPNVLFPVSCTCVCFFFQLFFSLREKKCQKHNLNSTESQEKKSSLNSHSFVIKNYTQNSLASGISHTNSLSHTHSKSGKPGPGSTRRPSERPTDPSLRRRYGSTSCPEVIECLGKKP